MLAPTRRVLLLLVLNTLTLAAAHTTTNNSNSRSTPSVAPPVVQLPCGEVVGVWDEQDPSLAIFWSIPYAEPPVGRSGRWKPPQKPASCFHAPLDASKPGNICFQFDLLPFCATARPDSEDCLSLDIYTPALSTGKNLPVMVWLYGGSLVIGYTTSYANLRAFAETHQVVLVAVSYRLNAFGFLAHPALAAEDPRGVSGNFGILDQQLALQWVQDNIGAFGGNASSVTVIGQSSGGTSIFALLSSPASVGLMHGAISLSGSPNITMDLAAAYAQYDQVLQDRTSCTSTNLSAVADCLYSMTGPEVARMLPGSFNVGGELPVSPSGQNYPGLPIVDGVTVTTDLLTALSTGLVDVPLIIQTMLAEMDTISPNKTIYAMTPTEYSDFLESYLVGQGWPQGSGQLVSNLYADELTVSTELAYQQFAAEYSFLCGNIQLALAAGQGYKSPVYLSLVTHSPGNPLVTSEFLPPALYPGHLWDYIMGTNAWNFFRSCSLTAPLYTPTTDDILLGNSLLAQWQNLTVFHNLDAFAPNVLPVNAVSGFPASYNMILQGQTGPSISQSYNAERCAALTAPPLNLNQSFWLCN